jgi:hypothetical protein
MPMQMPMQDDLYNQYFQTGVHPHMSMAPTHMDDLRMDRVDTTGGQLQFAPGQAMLGLPGGADMMQHLHSHVGTPLGNEGQVDPMLLAFDQPHHQEHIDPGMALHPEFRNGHLSMADRELDQDSVQEHPHDDFHSEHWQPDPNMAPMEQGSEFEKWMDDHHAG